MVKVNPFKPNSPVPTAMFAGRIDEIVTLEQSLHQAKNSRPTNILITGERGIGKSSLMMLFEHLANGNIKSPIYDAFNFLTISVVISKQTSLLTLIKLIERKISREIGGIEKIRTFLLDTWSFVQRIKVMDSGIDKQSLEEDSDLLLDDFAYSLSETCKRITNPDKGEQLKNGMVFLIDEADNACDDLHIGYFVKVVAELLQQNGCNNVMFVLAGLPEVVEKLNNSHPSSIRIFTQLKIRELSQGDRHYVIEKGLEEGNRINETKTTITDEAKKHISTLSEGYPHFIQQFAYSAFQFNQDGEISADDVLGGAFDPGGALDSIGSRYYESAYREQIKSDEYRQVLSIMAENMNEWIKKSDIRTKFSGNDQTLTDALKALTSRNIILKNTSKVGEYRLQQKGFALWIKLFGERKK